MLRIVHSADRKEEKPKAPTRKEKAMRWMMIQQRQDRQKALEYYKAEIEEIRKTDPLFTL